MFPTCVQLSLGVNVFDTEFKAYGLEYVLECVEYTLFSRLAIKGSFKGTIQSHVFESRLGLELFLNF